MLGSERIEVVRGSNGIIHGADAIGGVVNLLSAKPSFSESGVTQEGDFLGRLSSAERSWSAGLQGTVSVRTGLRSYRMWSVPSGICKAART